MKEVLWKVLVQSFQLMPAHARLLLGRILFAVAASRRNAARGLRELLEAEESVQWQLNQCAIRFEGGIHPKHRLMDYHRFFTERLRPGERVLDVGCGYGALAFSLVRSGAQVTGIDLKEENIRSARHRYPHAGLVFIQGDVRDGLPSGPFDVIVLSNVLEHLEDRSRFLQRLVETTDAGRLLIRVPMLTRDWIVPLKRELGLPYYSDPTHKTEYTHESFTTEIKEAGLKIDFLQFIWGEIWAEVSVA